MTVAELIEKLKAMPQDALVVCNDRWAYTEPNIERGFAKRHPELGTDGVYGYEWAYDAEAADGDWKPAVFL